MASHWLRKHPWHNISELIFHIGYLRRCTCYNTLNYGPWEFLLYIAYPWQNLEVGLIVTVTTIACPQYVTLFCGDIAQLGSILFFFFMFCTGFVFCQHRQKACLAIWSRMGHLWTFTYNGQVLVAMCGSLKKEKGMSQAQVY